MKHEEVAQFAFEALEGPIFKDSHIEPNIKCNAYQ